MRRTAQHCCGAVTIWLLAAGWSLGSSAASTALAPVTNTGLNNIHFKSVRCSEAGFWMLDVINNNFAPSTVEYFFWLKTIRVMRLMAMQASSIWRPRAVSRSP